MDKRILSDEELLGIIKKNGGGGGGTTNYNSLSNKPQIAGTELEGNKSLADLGIASAQSVSDITNGESINNFAGVETALSDKQDALTFDNVPTENSTNPVKSGGVYSALAGKQNALSAGSHIDISNNAVSVNRYVNPAGDIVYRAVTVNATTAYVDKYTPGGTFIERINVTVNTYQSQDVESKIRFYREFDGWVITLLANSKEHNAGYSYSARISGSGVESQNDFTFTISQTLDDNDLIIRSELATKANTDMVAADFNAGTSYTAGNYCIYDGKFYKFKNSHSGAWAAADVDEIKIAGELSSLKSGLTNYVKIDYAHLAANTTLQAGFIDVQFTVPTIEGYKPIGVVTYNLGDRALSASVHISGIDMRQSVAHIYGSVSQEVIITTAAYVSIIYIRDI